MSLWFWNEYLDSKTNSNKKVINYKVIKLFKIYNFSSSHFSIQGHLEKINFKFENIQP
jgi:hypothetical protein